MLSDSGLLWTRIAAGVFVFLAVNAAYGIWLQKKKARGGKSWPVAPGEIIASQVEQPRTHRSDEEADCTFTVRYRYRAGGKDYESHRVRFGGQAHTTRLQAEELTDKYPVGARVRVHYNPRKPSEAVLEPDDTSTLAALIVMLVVTTTVASVLIAHALAGKVLTTESGVPLWVLLGPITAMGLGVVAIGAYVNLLRERLASRHWPTAAGKITASAVESEVDTQTDDKGHHSTQTVYRPAIRFAYRVGEREYHSSHWKWGWTALYSSPARPEAIVAQYPVGKEVPVYYDPAQPETAVLDPVNKTGVGVSLLVGIFLILGGAIFLWGFFNLTMQ
jgi:hypothetical protein